MDAWISGAPPLDALAAALTTLIVAVDPVGLAPIFVGLTAGFSAATKRSIALRATIIAFVVLALFSLVGERLLSALGIALPAFRISGGLLLFYVAFEMVFERREDRKRETAERAADEGDHHRIAAFPLAIPLMAGPGAVTACILLAGELGTEPIGLAALLAVIALVCVSCLLCFLAAGTISRLLGDTGRIVLTRLLGMILAALAVQFVSDGVRGLITGT
ncbi:MAG: MarC family protein [Pseudomonadota bacterium]